MRDQRTLVRQALVACHLDRMADSRIFMKTWYSSLSPAERELFDEWADEVSRAMLQFSQNLISFGEQMRQVVSDTFPLLETRLRAEIERLYHERPTHHR